MLRAALRDLQFRRRRVVITVIGTSLVLALTLVLGGIAASFDAEADDVADRFGAEWWVQREDSSGPLVGASYFPADAVEVGDPVAFAQLTLEDEEGSRQRVSVFGVEAGGLGAPAGLAAGRAVVSTEAGTEAGERISLGSGAFEVVDEVDATVLAAMPVVYLTIDDLAEAAFAGQRIIGATGGTGERPEPPEGFVVVDGSAAAVDLLDPVDDAAGAILFLSVLLWAVATLIIGATVYVSVLERSRDFAVFKAIGASNRSLAVGVAFQAIVVAVTAAAIGTVVALALAPTFPLAAVVEAPAVVLLFVLACLAGLLASAVGVRRVASVDPASAFGGP